MAAGFKLRSFFCTYLAERLIDGDQTPIRKGSNAFSLKAIAEKRLGITIKEKIKGEHFLERKPFEEEFPTEEEITYMVEDVVYLETIREQQIKTIIQQGLVRVAKIEMVAQFAIAEMELGGLNLDVPKWLEAKEEYKVLAKNHEEVIREYVVQFAKTINVNTRGDNYKDYDLTTCGFGFHGTAKTLYTDVFKVPVISTDVKTREALIRGELLLDDKGTTQPLTDEQKPVIKFAELMERRAELKAITKWRFEDFVHEKTGRVHPSLRQYGAGTGRLSCTDPNFQQMPQPIEGFPNLRTIWLPDTPDYKIAVGDWEQQEPRLMAQIIWNMFQDTALRDACNAEDVYLAQGEILYGRKIHKKDRERQVAKMGVLALGYGAGDGRLSYQTGEPLEKCGDLRTNMYRAFPGLLRYKTEVPKTAKQYRFVESLTGRRRYVMTPEEQDRLQRGGKVGKWWTKSLNNPVQMSGADLMKHFLGQMWLWIDDNRWEGTLDKGTRMWLTVHDEAEVHSHIDDLSTVTTKMSELMVQCGNDIAPDVAHFAEIRTGDTWFK
jgi:DNA polymerase-1